MKNNIINKFMLVATCLAGISFAPLVAPDYAVMECVRGILIFFCAETVTPLTRQVAPLPPGTIEYQRTEEALRTRILEILTNGENLSQDTFQTRMERDLSRLNQEYSPRLGEPAFLRIILTQGIRLGARIEQMERSRRQIAVNDELGSLLEEYGWVRPRNQETQEPSEGFTDDTPTEQQ